jgi:hypothetical protein
LIYIPNSAFSWGHAITNLLGGWAAVVLSPKDVLSMGVVVSGHIKNQASTSGDENDVCD